MKTLLVALLFLDLISGPAPSFGADKPKYGPATRTLSEAHDFFRKNAAPDFWALMPYYVGQQDGRSCSLASVTLVLNAVRSKQRLKAEDELLTQPGVLKKTGSKVWSTGVGALGRGVTLDQLGEIVRQALSAHSLKVSSVEVMHADSLSEEIKRKFRNALAENEKSTRDFIIANFDQGVFTGDTSAGHIAPVGAYDAEGKRVLILDPDRQWYEPYWVPEELFLSGMATPDSESGKNRGLVWVRLEATP